MKSMKPLQILKQSMAAGLIFCSLLLPLAPVLASAPELGSMTGGTLVYESTLSVKPVRLLVNGKEAVLTDPVRNINGRIYYPFRSCLESMGAAVDWQASTRTATGTLGEKTVAFTVGSKDYKINGLSQTMPDAIALLDVALDRVYLPIRYAAEALGFETQWVRGELTDTISLTGPAGSTVLSRTDAIQIDGRILRLGDAKDQVIRNFGQPTRVDPSAYGLQWYVYHQNYENFIMIGIAEDQVAGFFSNAKNLKLKNDLGQGASTSEIDSAYSGSNVMEFWFDPNDNNGLYAVWCMKEKPTESQAEQIFLKTPDLLLRTYERECLDITNAFRARYNQPAVEYSALATRVAQSYTKDMALRDYFSHTNPEGDGPLDRILAGGLDVQKVTENLAAGYPDAIQVLKGWVDSASHRQGMLESNEYLGVGAYYYADSKYQYYMAQEFYTLWH